MSQAQPLVELRKPEQTSAPRTAVMVAVCTYHRNGPLRTLLEATLAAAAHVRERAATGVVVVDDDPAAGARNVVAEFADRFELGVHYRHSGKRNISLARNLALETAARLADWVLMTDDDCEPKPQWFAAHLDAQQQTQCDATTGSMALRAPPGTPKWVSEEPFFEDYAVRAQHLQPLPGTGTNNVMLRSAWVLAHPEIRFLEEFGRTGGEDWIFFVTARKQGLKLCFSAEAEIIGNETPDRMSWRYLLRNRLWLGNSEWFLNEWFAEHPRAEMIDRGWDNLAIALMRLVRELPRYRYPVSRVARWTGYLLGTHGIRLHHH